MLIYLCGYSGRQGMDAGGVPVLATGRQECPGHARHPEDPDMHGTDWSSGYASTHKGQGRSAVGGEYFPR
jgi:hypothetical protein